MTGTSFPVVPSGDSSLSRRDGFISSDYLYPLLMQAQICALETDSFGIKNAPDQMFFVFCISSLIAAMCEWVRIMALAPGEVD